MQELAFVVGHEQFVINLSAVSVELLFGQSDGSGLQRQCDGGLYQWPAFEMVAFGHGLGLKCRGQDLAGGGQLVIGCEVAGVVRDQGDVAGELDAKFAEGVVVGRASGGGGQRGSIQLCRRRIGGVSEMQSVCPTDCLVVVTGGDHQADFPTF